MENSNEMSTNIADLNSANMQELSSNIQQEIDDGKANDYLSADRLNNLQQMQMQQLQQLQQMQQMQQMQQIQQQVEPVSQPVENNSNNSNNEIEESSSGMMDLVKDPLMALALFVVLSHPMVLDLLGKWIPNLCPGEDCEIGIQNLFVQGLLFVTLYFGIKLFLLK